MARPKFWVPFWPQGKALRGIFVIRIILVYLSAPSSPLDVQLSSMHELRFICTAVSVACVLRACVTLSRVVPRYLSECLV